MRVGFDATNILGHGGVKTYSRELIKALARIFMDDEFHLFSTSSRGKYDKLASIFADHPGIILHRGLPHALMLGSRFRNLSSAMGSVYWRFAERNLDLVHMTDPYSCAGTPDNYVVTLHDLFPLTRAEFAGTSLSRFYRCRTPAFIRKSRMIIAPSQYTADSIAGLFPESEKSIQVIPEAASERFRPLGRDSSVLSEYGLEKARYFLFIGRVDGRKNIHRIIESFQGLREDEPDLHLVLVLSGGSPLTGISHGEYVHILRSAPDEDIPQLYSNAIAFVFPSLDEGFGLPVLEAMKCGCPVITSCSGSLPEVAGQAALLVDPESIDDLRSAMRILVREPQRRKALHDSGVEQAGRFTWERSASMTMDVYRRALSC